MNITLTSLKLDNKNISCIWYDNKWFCSALDVVETLINPVNPKTYWSKIKDRNKDLNPYLVQVKIKSSDNKLHAKWFIDLKGINLLAYLIPIKDRTSLINLIAGLNKSSDERSRDKAYTLWNSGVYKSFEIGTTNGLQQIHGFIFGGIYDFAGQIRNKNISKDGFLFSLCQHFVDILPNIDRMPQKTFEQIIEKYICMNIAHPFMEGNGRSTRIWLDLILKKELGKCIDWSKIKKDDYFKAMKISHDNNEPLLTLLKSALTNKINDREIFMKGIDSSYFYEGLEK